MKTKSTRSNPITGREFSSLLKDQGHSVKKIGQYFFAENSRRERVYFPDSDTVLPSKFRSRLMATLTRLGLIVGIVLILLSLFA